jgi:hypothetical protein
VYGDTHVEPARLFDPGRGEAPPPDALDVYFHAPLSLSLVAGAFAQHGMDRELELLREAYLAAAGRAVCDLQRQGGYVAGGHRGRAIPARLELTSVVEDTVPSVAGARLHTHVYLGRSAVALTEYAGQRHPVHLDELRQGMDFAWGSYYSELERETERLLGFVWDSEPGRHSARTEIVHPPMAEALNGLEFGLCPGEFGRREQILADARWRAGIEEMERFMAADRARGSR